MQTEHAAELLQNANYTVALTGAGISTPSGIPDFRSSTNGLWHKYNPMQVASLSAFRTRPEKFFDWFQPLAQLIVDAEPNPAHLALTRLQDLGILKTIITQNIDGLHHRAGSRSIYEIHGTLNSLTCVQCYHQYPSSEFIQPYLEAGVIPRCTRCGGLLKPDVILFEEQLPREVWRKAEEEIRKCDLMIVVGSSLEVNPVAQLPYKVVAQGGKLVIVNKQHTYMNSRADVVFSKDAAEVLPMIIEKLDHV